MAARVRRIPPETLCENELVPKLPDSERIDRLEAVVQVLAEDQVSLKELIAQLARETHQGFDQVARQFAETDRRIEAMQRETDRRMAEMQRETDRRFRETDERFRRTDERIDQMVYAIGELIRQRPG